MDERTLSYPYILIDVDTVERWLYDCGVTVDDKRAAKIVDYIYQDVLDRAWDLVMDADNDIKED